MVDCCKGYKDLEDQIIYDSDTVCGGTLEAIDLETLLSPTESLQSVSYDILTGAGSSLDSVGINGSVLELSLKNPDSRPYTSNVLVSIVGESFKYKVRVKVHFEDRCAGVECEQDEYCDPCTGGCVAGEVDLRVSAGSKRGKVKLAVS